MTLLARAAALVVVACAAGCASDALSSVDDVGRGSAELTDDKVVALRLEPGAPAQRFFVPVALRGGALSAQAAIVDVDVATPAPFRLVLAAQPEQTSPSLAWSIVEDGFGFSFDLDDLSGERLAGVELGVAAADVAVDVDLLLRLRVSGEDPTATAAFGALEPHAP